MSDFERIGKVIRFADKNRGVLPEIKKAAYFTGLSEPDFRRLFCRWGGLPPEDFLQGLKPENTIERLRAGNRALDTGIESGLFRTGRFHELRVNAAVATPGEISPDGTGWVIQAGYAETPFGICLIAEGPRGICHLSFGDDGWNEIRADWPRAELIRDDGWAEELCRAVFMAGQPRTTERLTLRLFVKGSPFQVKVWRALLHIPDGQLASYGKVAELIGSPKASRAVGAAVGNNPIAFLIPCHRVIRGSGALGGYRWGIARKRAIQAWEFIP